MKTARVLVGLLAGLVSLGGSPALACVVTATPLWEILQKSDVIAVARVEGFERKPAQPGGCAEGAEMDVAVLKILDPWKGSPGGTLRLDFTEELSAGGRKAAAGDRILVFLESGEAQIRRSREATAGEEPLREKVVAVEGDEVITEPLSEQDVFDMQEATRRWEESRMGRWFLADYVTGFLAVEDETVPAARDLVARAVRLQETGPVSPEEIREWLIQAASVRSLRRRAIQDLEAMLGYPRLKAGEAAPVSSGLTEAEMRALADSFSGDPAADSSLPVILGLLHGFEDDGFDRAVVSVIEAGVAAEKVPYWIPEAIRQVIARRGWRDWGSALWHRYAAEGTLKDIWPAVARDLRLPVVSPARLRVENDD